MLSDDSIVKLLCSDGVVLEAPVKVLKLSKTIKNILEDVPAIDEAIPMPTVNSVIMKMVIDFCAYHADNPQPNDDKELTTSDRYYEVLCDFDKEFTEMKADPETGVVDQGMFVDLFNASDYLDVNCLHWACAHSYAHHIKEKNTEEIRHMFGIVNDFTPEEEEQVRRENDWRKDPETDSKEDEK